MFALRGKTRKAHHKVQGGGAPVTRRQARAAAATLTGAAWINLPPERWRRAEFLTSPEFSDIADTVLTPGWGGALSALDKVNLYVRLIERQDDLFIVAMKIIYAECGILDPDAADVENTILEQADRIASRDAELKEYFKDVYRLLTLQEPDTPTGDGLTPATKLTRLLADPLINIVMRPARVRNLFIERLAKILVTLKTEPAFLDRIKSRPDLYAMFADIYNSYIQSEVLKLTSKSNRDGFFLWQRPRVNAIPDDTCGFDTATTAAGCFPQRASIVFFQNFCKNYGDSATGTSTIYDDPDAEYTVARFSRLTADLFKMYRGARDAATLRTLLVQKFARYTRAVSITNDKALRPNDVLFEITSPLSAMMRKLLPNQYHFLFHLLYAMQQEEELRREGPAQVSVPSN